MSVQPDLLPESAVGPVSEAELTELLQEVRRVELVSRRAVHGAMAGGYASTFRGHGIEFEEVREYVPGDDPRAVDWNVTARTGRPYVKQFVEERELTVLFLLDLSRSLRVGGFGALSGRQVAARIAACIALSAARHDDKVGLVGFGAERVESWLPPRKGDDHVLRLIRDVLALRERPGRAEDAAERVPGGGMADALRFVAQRASRNAVVFVLSDWLDLAARTAASDQRGLRDALALAALRHDLVAVRIGLPEVARLADPSARRVPRGLLHLQDPESGRALAVDLRSRAVLDRVRARIDAWDHAVDDVLVGAGVDRLDVPMRRAPGSGGDPELDAAGLDAAASDGAVVQSLMAFFGARRRRG